MSDQDIYQIAKNYVTGLIQKIVFEDYLPILLGNNFYNQKIGKYSGYNQNINPNIFT